MERIDGAFSIYRQEFFSPRPHRGFRVAKFSAIGRRPFADLRREIGGQGIRQDEIAISQSLHERARAEPVRPVIGKVRFADDVQAGNIAHQIIVHPEPAHRVMDRGINPHRALVGIFGGDLFVNVKQVAVAFADCVFAETRDRIREIEVNAATAFADAAAFIANFLGGPRRDIARR